MKRYYLHNGQIQESSGGAFVYFDDVLPALDALRAAIEGCENNHPLDADITSWLPAARAALAKLQGAA